MFIGTMSLNEIAVDLTCHPEPFQPAQTDSFEFIDEEAADHHVWRQSTSRRKSRMKKQCTFFVHSGMLRMAKAMGDIGKPVQLAVREALYNNPGFGEFSFSGFWSSSEHLYRSGAMRTQFRCWSGDNLRFGE